MEAAVRTRDPALPGPPDQVVRMHDAYWHEGVGYAEAGRREGVGRERVRRLFLEHRLPVRTTGETLRQQRSEAVTERREQIVKLWGEGLSGKQIAQHPSVQASPSTVYQHLQELVPAGERDRRAHHSRRFGRGLTYSTEMIQSVLRTAAEHLGRTPSVKAYDRIRKDPQLAQGWPTSAAIERRYGTWRAACRDARLTPNAGPGVGHSARFGPTADLEAILRVRGLIGDWPSIGDYGEHHHGGAEPSAALIRVRRRGWQNALAEAAERERGGAS